MNNAVASGSYADMKLVKTRSVCQIVVEIPIEQASRFIEMFGVPVPGAEIPVAIARLNEGAVTSEIEEHSTPSAVAKGSDTPRRKFEDMSPSQQAGMLCADAEFYAFLSERYGSNFSGSAADFVRHWCGVSTRKQLNDETGPQEIWNRLASSFRAWRTDKRYEEMRL